MWRAIFNAGMIRKTELFCIFATLKKYFYERAIATGVE